MDIRGDGGYVVAAPSLHLSGQRYAWKGEGIGEVAELPDAPDWLIELMHRRPAARIDTSDSIPDGRRNADLTSFAGTMRRRGMQENEILAALLEINSSRCDPPLGENEVRAIAKSVAGYLPNTDTARTDLGNAQRLIIRHGDDLCYCYAWKCWMVWKGGRWVRDVSGEIEHRAKETVRAIRDEAALIPDQAEAKKLQSWAIQSESRARITAIPELARSELPVMPSDFDRDPWLLNVQNGTLDLKTGLLHPHQRKDLLSKIANVSFDPDAHCRTWLGFLDRIFAGDKELISYVKTLVGYALTGETGEQTFHVLYGKGANGKTTFIETLLRLVGDYGQKAEFSTLLAHSNDNVRNDIAALRGARLVAATEAERGRRLNEPLVKELTGGDTIRARFLFQEYFEFRPQFKLLLATNYKPEIYGIDEGIWRRVHLIPFAITIPVAERDKRLLEKLDRERAGISSTGR